MNINPGIFKAYDIRGIYPKDIDEESMRAIMRAIYSFFSRKTGRSNLSVALGHDMRLSSPSLTKASQEELVKMGATVLDIGLVPTPTTYFAGLKLQADVVIQISASHNPKEYAGVKFAMRVGDKLEKVSKVTGMEDVKRMVLESDFEPYPTTPGTLQEVTNMVGQEIDSLLKEFPVENFKKYKIVADAANAMGAVFLTELFQRIPVDLVKMNFELDGSFPVHQPDPLEFKNLESLQRKIIEEKADLGLAPDGDGDRIFFVDEKGKIIPATLITSLVAREVLKEHKNGKILVDIRYTRNAVFQIEKYGGVPVMSQVGHALITALLNKEGALFAGESSGHFYFKETGGAESSMKVILYVLAVMARENKPISQIIEELHTSVESGEFNFVLPENVTAATVVEAVLKDYPEGKVSKLDGVAIEYSDWRCSIRSSNTEPLLRLNVEGKDEALVEEHLKKLTDKILFLGGKPKEHH